MIRQPEPEPARRPYAATANLMAVLGRARSRNLPTAINDDFLAICGVGSAVYGRVHQALQFLNLAELDGSPTERLRRMAAAPDPEFRQELQAAVREAYADDFRNVNPEVDTPQQITEAFRRYEPRSQTSRMVMLFLGLCREAGIPLLEAPRERAMRMAARPTRANGQSRRPAGRGQPPPPPPPPPAQAPTGLAFGLTHDDISKLTDQEFDEVWAALGKVERARARKPPPSPPAAEEEEVNPE